MLLCMVHEYSILISHNETYKNDSPCTIEYYYIMSDILLMCYCIMYVKNEPNKKCRILNMGKCLIKGGSKDKENGEVAGENTDSEHSVSLLSAEKHMKYMGSLEVEKAGALTGLKELFERNLSKGGGDISRMYLGLRELIIRECLLCRVPPDIDRCVNLEYLDLSRNYIRSLGGGRVFSKIRKLVSFTVSSNRINEVTDRDLEGLKHLN